MEFHSLALLIYHENIYMTPSSSHLLPYQPRDLKTAPHFLLMGGDQRYKASSKKSIFDENLPEEPSSMPAASEGGTVRSGN